MTTESTQAGRAAESFNGILSGAFDCLHSAIHAGVKLQQDAIRIMTDRNGGGKSFEQMRRRTEVVADETMTAVRKNADAARELFDRTSKSGLDAVRSCFDAVCPADAEAGRFGAAERMWKATFEAVQSSVDAVAKANLTMIENFTDIAGSMSRSMLDMAGRN